jgi:sortase A
MLLPERVARTIIRTMSVIGLALVFSPSSLADDQVIDGAVWYMLPEPDQSDWSNKRRSGYAKTDAGTLGVPEAVLQIPELELSVAVYDNAQRPALERGAGWVEGTAQPGQAGNVAIAGHRDGYFRPLENIEPGQEIVLQTGTQKLRYRVADISIVDPLDVDVLDATESSMLTLITCYPFRYVGFAPDRFIVRAQMIGE